MLDVTKLARTAAIVRTYRTAAIDDFVLRLVCLGIGHVVVVVPEEQDGGVTRSAIGALTKSYDIVHRVSLVERRFTHGGRAWSGMLNAGLDFLEQSALAPEFTLMVSNTVLLGASHLERLVDDMVLPSNMVAGLKFRGLGKAGEPVSLGKAYNHHFRNTLALYRSAAFSLDSRLRRFIEDFDGEGGMEDLAWKRILETVTSFRAAENVNLPERLCVPLSVHQHRTEEEQAAYEAVMEQGIAAAERYVATLLSEH